MANFLDIIIPEYDCPIPFMKRLLTSINIQKNIYFNAIGIIIVNDHSKNRYKKSWFKSNFPKLNITYVVNEKNVGQGMARQAGLNMSTAHYVTFVDQDDMLNTEDPYSLARVLLYLQDHSSDFVFSGFDEEVKFPDGRIGIFRAEKNPLVCLHGLFIKRQFLIDFNLGFDPNIRYHEDTYLIDILLRSNHGINLNVTSYMWKYNEDSQVRKKRKHHFFVETFSDYMKARQDAYLYIIKYFPEEKEEYLLNLVYRDFAVLDSKAFALDDLVDLKKKYEKELYDYILANPLPTSITPERSEEVMNAARIETGRSGLTRENPESFEHYLNRMKEEYGNA